MLASPTNNAEKDHHDDISLAGDGFDTVIKVSCADILALATREVVSMVLLCFL
ncbi:Peroxidase 73 [Linum perenne]